MQAADYYHSTNIMKMKTKTFSEQDLKVLTTDGFFERYFQETRHATTGYEAWMLVEEIYRSITGEYRWKNVNAFRMALYRYLRKSGRK